MSSSITTSSFFQQSLQDEDQFYLILEVLKRKPFLSRRNVQIGASNHDRDHYSLQWIIYESEFLHFPLKKNPTKKPLLTYAWIVAKVILQSKDNIIAKICLQITYCD